MKRAPLRIINYVLTQLDRAHLMTNHGLNIEIPVKTPRPKNDNELCPRRVMSVCAMQVGSPCGQSQRSRRLWLQTNQPLLRMFLSYCSLHGSHGGGLASVRMELILLLQESHQVSRRKETYGRPAPVAVHLGLPVQSQARNPT